MIQRIQSLYLFIIAILTGLMMFLPVAKFMDVAEVLKLTGLGIVDQSGETIITVYGLAVVVIAASVLPLVTIFLFKNRMLQFRLCVVEIVLLAGVLLCEAYYIWHGYDLMREASASGHMTVGFVALLPVLSLIFNFLALRGIKKDIVLVKSLDRIR